MASIQQECEKRNIDCIFHFSPVDHLDSILRRGLLVPSACKGQSVGMKPNDTGRFDGQDAICLSVEWPNYKLYWNFHKQDEARPWAIIAIQHRVLWEKRVCFNTTNAAHSSMSSQTFEARQGVGKFLEMFGNCSGKTRADLKIPDCFTTDYQAEVLCLDSIEPSYFTVILLDKLEVFQHYKAAYPQVNFSCDSTYFKYRRDYEHWR